MLIALGIQHSWPPNWWRSTSWPEFKLILLMKNEHDSEQAERELREESGMPARDPRMGQPPPREELDVLPRH